jgi:hypothetical protein
MKIMTPMIVSPVLVLVLIIKLNKTYIRMLKRSSTPFRQEIWACKEDECLESSSIIQLAKVSPMVSFKASECWLDSKT